MVDRINVVVVAIVLVTLCLGDVDAQYSMDVHLSPSDVIVEGGTVEATCEVSNWQLESSMFVVWVRRFDGEEVELSTNDHPTEKASKTGRYSARKELRRPDDFTKVRFYLTITAVKTYDSGQLICRIPNQLEVATNFTVVASIQSIRMTSASANGSQAMMYSDGQPVVFDEAEPRHFYCHVNGSYPQPVVSVHIGDLDVTDQFARTQELVRDGAVPGYKELYYRVKLASRNFSIRYEYDRQVFRCVARDAYGKLPERTIGINMTLSAYRPKLICAHQQYPAVVHQSNVTIHCVVRSQPPVNQTQVTFHWTTTDRRNVTLSPGQRNGHYFADMLPGTVDSEKTLVLRIDRVYPQHFRTYYFQAHNDVGTTVRHLHLVRKSAGEQQSKSRADDVISSGRLLMLLSAVWSVAAQLRSP